jgi:hypothetical protein
MAYELKENSGSLFPNDKGDNPNRPDLKGQCLIDGIEFWVSAWKKEGNGKKFLSLSFTPKEQAGNQREAAPAAAATDADIF